MNKNMVLIGMPGCGKSAIGKILAEKQHLHFADLDAIIEQKEQKTIAQIFAEQGEIAFRDIETACVKKVSQKRGQVIATGGGVVLRKENMDALSENGILIFIDRPIADIANENLSDRPLLAADKNQLFALYEQRIFLYRSYGEWIVNFAGTPEEIAAWITERAKEKEQ